MPLTTVGIRAIDDFANGPRDWRLDAWVANNDVEMAGPSAALRFGVRLVGSATAALVNNRIAGTGRAGVFVDCAVGCRIQSTDFSAFTPQGPVGVPFGHLFFEAHASSCVAVTVPAEAPVIDFGVDNVVHRTAR